MNGLVLSSALRPWIQAGLSVLLVDNPERAAELRAVPVSQAAAPGDAEVPARPVPGASRPPAQRVAPARAAKQDSPQAAPRPLQRDNAESQGRVLAPDAWPAAWQALRKRRPLPPRPLVFWTYAGLGDDLMGTPDPIRQRVIVRMLRELGHPGGTHVFWPYALPGDDAPGGPDAPSLFWSGAALLRPRTLLLFGSEARDALGMPKSLYPYCQERLAGRMVIQLPQPLSLAHNEAAFRQAQAFLRGLLSFCATPRG
ncbi:MAG: hypothetical protein J1E80_02335 [Desulfovibrionaceae bacterium]|nr:hypothetical protein [Desulfovibrionaceae bacterium]